MGEVEIGQYNILRTYQVCTQASKKEPKIMFLFVLSN